MNIRTFLTITALSTATCFSVFAEEMDEKKFQKLMKEVGDAAKRFKASNDNQDSAQITKDSTRVAEAYQAMAGFWKKHNKADAVKWSEESAAAAKATAASAKQQDWEKVKSNWQGVMKHCKSCHEAYRVKLEDGSYKIKWD